MNRITNKQQRSLKTDAFKCLNKYLNRSKQAQTATYRRGMTKSWRDSDCPLYHAARSFQNLYCDLYCSSLANPSSFLLCSFINFNVPSLLAIRDWSLNSPSSHLAGGMTYSNCKVTVPISGRYYLYTQMYMINTGSRVYIMVNNKEVTMINPMHPGSGTIFTARVFKLNAGDVIMLKVNTQPFPVYMSKPHCYFGAYLI